MQFERFFDLLQFILGDSAYTPHPTVIPAYKKLPNQALNGQQEYFNTLLAKCRIMAEHTIGMLKGKLQSLKCLRHVLTRDPGSVDDAIRHIEVCVILHNICIDDGMDDEWMLPDLVDVVTEVEDQSSIADGRSRDKTSEVQGKKRREYLANFLYVDL